MRLNVKTGLAALAIVALAGCETSKQMAAPTPAPTPNIVEAAAATDELSTLVAAVKAAGLVETLSGDGPFTVIAPNNGAFAPLGIAAEDVPASVLKAHVIPGKLMAADVLAAIEAGNGVAQVDSASGAPIFARTVDGKVFFRGEGGGPAKAVATDIVVSNGVVHIVDGVLGFGDVSSTMDGFVSAAEPGSAAQVCGDNGHDVVTWSTADGDPVQACRRADGVEYALKDAAFFVE